ncbi:tol-pal system protein YbgF [Massilia sp. Dwa41.01b]|uniref:tol-pal system protein YbgF n=1 Tax=unclassified Massilia TaxID=2609279 RepID=UPI0015FF57A0|nr:MULTISPECIES: tol-pal system protein YbgF [unclassified Massilia]QNA88509.1 tol-pal system protein YbgF [Massilia sp. Dwa41.01b]QNA99406.1 tol-pal system protein YbgF [Massilia sp. Se16.2.3]
MIKLSPSRLAAMLLAFVLPLQASAGLLDDDEARRAILDLRAKVDNITRDLTTRLDAKSDKTVTLDILNQHEQTMAEIAKLRGQIEVLANEVAKAQNSQRTLYADLDARIKKLEPRQENIDGQTAEVLPSEKQAYDSAMEILKTQDYKRAASALQDFVKRYPESAYAPNAQYWLGNAYYALGDYKNAILAQEVVTTAYGSSPKAPDAMLNIATSYAQLKEKAKAKKALQALVSKFPSSQAAQAAKDRLAALK